MKKLHDRHYPAGLEWVILKKLPMVLLGGIFIPLFMSIIVTTISCGRVCNRDCQAADQH